MTDNQQPSPGNPVAPLLPQAPDRDTHGNPAKVVDHGSELVDTDPAFEGDPAVEEEALLQVHYSFAGGGLAGQNLMLCDLCSAIVREDRTEGHTNWHRNGGA